VRLILALLICTIASAQERIAVIDFYNSAGADLAALRSALPIHEGDTFATPEAAFDQLEAVQQAVRRVLGKDPTEIAPVCCYGQRDWMLFIGLPTSTRPPRYNSAPKGRQRLPPSATELYTQTMDALGPALQAGNVAEDRSQGYAISNDPALRAKQLEIRAFALSNQRQLLDVLKSASSAPDRAVAAHFLGYAQQSPQQLAALTRAVTDPDPSVRNNATRALDVLVESSAQLAARIDPTPFIPMLSSGIWMDRNKASMMIGYLTEARPPKLLATLRQRALPSLIEMAQWRSKGHAQPSLTILGRIAGIEEKRLQELIASDQREEILRAIRPR
jgi:hypothetical protein